MTIRSSLLHSGAATIKYSAALAAGVVISAGTALAGPLNTRHVPADASTIVHIDIEAAVGSTIGQFIIANGGEMGIEQLSEIQKIEEEIGLNPLEDVFDLTIILDGKDIEVIVATTNSTIDDALEAIQKKFGESFETERVGGHELIAIREGGDPMFVYVESSGKRRTVVAGRDAERVASIVSLTEGDGKSLRGSDSPLAGAKPADGSILFVASLDTDEIGENSPASTILGEASAIFIQGGEDDGEAFAKVSLAIGDENANKVAQMAAGLVAMGQLLAQNDGASDEVGDARVELLSAIEFGADDGNVEVSFRYDVEKFLGLLQEVRRE